jgi:hypothetical protein
MRKRGGALLTLEDSLRRPDHQGGQTFRLRVMARTQEWGNVLRACREFGISRSLFYRRRKRYVAHARDGLHPAGRARHGGPRHCPAPKPRGHPGLGSGFAHLGPGSDGRLAPPPGTRLLAHRPQHDLPATAADGAPDLLGAPRHARSAQRSAGGIVDPTDATPAGGRSALLEHGGASVSNSESLL